MSSNSDVSDGALFQRHPILSYHTFGDLENNGTTALGYTRQPLTPLYHLIHEDDFLLQGGWLQQCLLIICRGKASDARRSHLFYLKGTLWDFIYFDGI